MCHSRLAMVLGGLPDSILLFCGVVSANFFSLRRERERERVARVRRDGFFVLVLGEWKKMGSECYLRGRLRRV